MTRDKDTEDARLDAVLAGIDAKRGASSAGIANIKATYRLPRHLVSKLKERAHQNRRSVNKELVRILAQYLEPETARAVAIREKLGLPAEPDES